jgi:hypothetical protein
MTEKDVLVGALNKLRTKGWVPRAGDIVNDGPHCVVTAIWGASGAGLEVAPPPPADAAYRRVTRLIGGTRVIRWNDNQESFEPVERLFLEAIAEIETDEVMERVREAAKDVVELPMPTPELAHV